jgi:ABC-2 type transport system permease protein
MTAFLNHFTFDFKTGLRNPTAMLMNYLFPLAFYGMMGGVMTKINPGYTNMLLPSMVIFALMVPTILGLPGPLVESREAGIFRSFKINGVPVLSILLYQRSPRSSTL